MFVSYLRKCGVTAGFPSILKNNNKCNLNKQHRSVLLCMYERFLRSRVGPNTYPDLVAKLFRFLSQLFQLTHCSCLTGTRDDNVLDLQSKHHTMTSHALTSIKHCSSDACSHDHVHASNLINSDFLEPIPMHVYVPDNPYLFTVIK